jgi:hypothetical protein
MKAKPILLVVITLIIGFVLGMLTSAQIRFHKLQPVRMYFSEERFREGFFNVIQPDEKQKAEIQEVLDKYAKLNIQLQGDMRKEFESNMQDLRKELDSKLTKEQIARLKVMDERRQEMTRQFRKNRNDSVNPQRRPGGPQFRHFQGDRGPMPQHNEMPPPPQGNDSVPPDIRK